MKLIKGKGLAWLLEKSNCKVLDLNFFLNGSDCIDDYDGKGDVQVYLDYLQLEWYKDIVIFLKTLQCIADLDK